MTPQQKRQLFKKYASGVVYVATEDHVGSKDIGSAFHVGDGVFVTARHVVENRTILKIAATQESTRNNKQAKGEPPTHSITHRGGEGKLMAEPYLHSDLKLDVAALRVEGIDAEVLELGGHLDDWLGTELVLSSVLLIGYPRIPFAKDPPVLVAASGEVNAVVDLYNVPNARFVVSQMARGGFSGAPAISGHGFVLGVVTDSLVEGDARVESGFCSVLSVEPILNCLHYHRIMPKALQKFWDEVSEGLFSEDES